MMRARGLLVITLAALLAACSRTEPTQEVSAATTVPSTRSSSARPHVVSSVPDVDACSLITRAELEPIFGTLKGDGRNDHGLRGERDCRFTNTEGQWLKLSVYGSERWDLEKDIVSELHPAAISSLGEEAFRVKQGTDSVVYVRKRNAILETSCSCGLDEAEQTARRAITRM
ncbi:MAG TPA: DUF3558 family protein [Vicinamibacterales bacterium]